MEVEWLEIGLIGLGKMGYNLALNMKEKGHTVVGYDKNQRGLKLPERKEL